MIQCPPQIHDMKRLIPNADPEIPLPLWLSLGVIYLFLPVIVFLAGWLKPLVSFPLLLIVSASVITMVARVSPSRHGSITTNIRSNGWIAIMAIVFALVTGLCEWMPQSNDYLKHQLLAGDLVQRSWPVRYQSGEDALYLCYGLGYYLLPAGISKLLGIQWLGTTSFLWAVMGLVLFFQGLRHQFGRLGALGVALFLLTAGLGAPWHFIKSGFIQSLAFPTHDSAGTSEMLMGLGLYTSNLDSFTRIFYQPQHCIVGWLGGLVIHELLVPRKRWAEAGAVLAATLFWSPLTALALGFIGLAAIASDFSSVRPRASLHLVSAILLTAVLTAYYIPHLPVAEMGFIWEYAKGSDWVWWYFSFLLCFVLVPASILFWNEKRHQFLGKLKPVVVTMTLLLIACPLFKMGYFSDLRMQVSGPAFLFLAMAIVKGLEKFPGPKLSVAYVSLVAVFLAGAVFPIFRTIDMLASGSKTDYSIATLRKQGLHDIRSLNMPGFDATAQYLGRSNSVFAQWLLKNP
jgi:hypothetical protein